jgi:hypothetical protein
VDLERILLPAAALSLKTRYRFSGHDGWMPVDRDEMLGWYRRNRARSRALFDLLAADAYYQQPIALRHPIVFYEGHLPAFSFNTLVKRGLGRPSIDARLEALFARGIDPEEAAEGHKAIWPDRAVVEQFAAEADRQVIDAIAQADVEQPGHPLLDRAEAVFAILEHEAMHQETLLYIWHRLPLDQKHSPPGYRPRVSGSPPSHEWVEVPGGCATLGVERGSIRFGWDNEFPSASAAVEPFAIERHDVTNERFLEFVESGGYRQERWWTPEDWRWVQTERVSHPLFWEREDGVWLWRAMFDRVPLPLSGRCTSATPKRRPTPGGAAHACRLRPNSSGPPTGRPRANGVFPGETPIQPRQRACSTLRVGIPNPPAVIQQDRAPGASTTSPATGGSGPRRRSPRFPASARWRRTRSIRAISSTVSTSS